MVDLSKLESELVERKVEDEYRRFKQRGYARKSRGKKKVDECMRIWNEIKIEEEWDQKLKVEIRRLKQRGYERKYKAKNQKLKRRLTNASQEQAARKLDTKKQRTVDYPRKTLLEVWRVLAPDRQRRTQPLARQIAASRRTGIRSINIQIDLSGSCAKLPSSSASDRGFAQKGHAINHHQGGVSGSCTKLAASGASDRGFAQKGHPINHREGGLSGPWLALGVASWRGLSRRGIGTTASKLDEVD